ncbi:hypothetical protein BCV72DRAFT_239653 [Rhizopus microsporus var. microsporus]|uniref:Uncharacterized protein n=1 Tax=Rhizopus microsporus var. microsporus TaxID=86635 RepID=A0A1X0RBG4_RHIZD|nr:hypothetical protein BCV72DRAFT_239653 [Rhizopus microsporus var. microsporus]
MSKLPKTPTLNKLPGPITTLQDLRSKLGIDGRVLRLPINDWRNIEAIANDHLLQNIENENPNTAFETIASNLKKLENHHPDTNSMESVLLKEYARRVVKYMRNGEARGTFRRVFNSKLKLKKEMNEKNDLRYQERINALLVSQYEAIVLQNEERSKRKICIREYCRI